MAFDLETSKVVCQAINLVMDSFKHREDKIREIEGVYMVDPSGDPVRDGLEVCVKIGSGMTSFVVRHGYLMGTTR